MSNRKRNDPPPKRVVYDDVVQGSEEWKALRRGIPTASHFGDILAGGEGKMRQTYMFNLAGERLSGLDAEDFRNDYMRRGNEMEQQALATYAFTHGVELSRPGFVRRGRVGCSPDSIIGDWVAAVEIKTMAPKLLIPKIIKKTTIPTEHIPQCAGVMLVCEVDRCDLSLFWPGLPEVVYPVEREEGYIKWMVSEIDRFCDELDSLVARLRGDPMKLVSEMEIPG